jgi:hypothetical protein
MIMLPAMAARSMNYQGNRAIHVAVLLCIIAVGGMAQDSDQTAQIDQTIAHMLDGVGHKVIMQPRIDEVASFGEAAVLHLIKWYNQTDDKACWPLVACLCQIQTDSALRFVQGILKEHKKEWATRSAIKDYPVTREDDITESLIELVRMRGVVGYDATERLKKMIDRKPSRAGQLVSALKDDKAQESFAYELGEILAFVSGYSHTWCCFGVPPGRDPVTFRNDFWRDWWKRNKDNDVFAWLVEAVTSDNESRQAEALQRLWAVADKHALPYFLKALDSPSTRVQYWGVVGLKSVQGTLPHSGLQYTWEIFEKEKNTIIPSLKQEFERQQPTKGRAAPPEAGTTSVQ